LKKYSIAILYLVGGGLFLAIGYSSFAQGLLEELTTQMNNPEWLIGFGYIFLIVGIIHFLIISLKRK
jgi:protein-S-isoprenylcysteine O-methyltransferase Ste14